MVRKTGHNVMTKLLFINKTPLKYILVALLFLFGCDEDNILDMANYDHCDLYSQYSEECEEIIDECNENNGVYTLNDYNENASWDDNDGCCCVFP